MKHYTPSSSKLLSKLSGSVAMISILLLGNVSAQAILPTPEPEMTNPSNLTNAIAVNQGQLNGSPVNEGQVNTANALNTKTVAALVSVDPQGQNVLKPIDTNTRLQKGNVIEYRTYITNNSTDRMRKMDISMSIPNEVKLLGDIEPKTASASVDGTNFSHMPLRGRINGQLKEVPLEYYKHLRWTIEGLGINETAVVKYRAVVR